MLTNAKYSKIAEYSCIRMAHDYQHYYIRSSDHGYCMYLVVKRKETYERLSVNINDKVIKLGDDSSKIFFATLEHGIEKLDQFKNEIEEEMAWTIEEIHSDEDVLLISRDDNKEYIISDKVTTIEDIKNGVIEFKNKK